MIPRTIKICELITVTLIDIGRINLSRLYAISFFSDTLYPNIHTTIFETKSMPPWVLGIYRFQMCFSSTPTTSFFETVIETIILTTTFRLFKPT